MQSSPVTANTASRASSTGSTGAGTSKTVSDYDEEFQNCVKEWYVEWDKKTYFVPDVHMNRVEYREESIAGQNVPVTKPPVALRTRGDFSMSLGDVKDDLETQRIIHCIRALADKENPVMFVLTNMGFNNYLSELCVEISSLFPVPGDLEKELKRGDFDLLIILRDYGLLVGELKAVGDNFQGPGLKEEEENVLKKRINKSINQLDKEAHMLSHLISDLVENLCIRKTLLLPNVHRAQLRALFDKDTNLKKNVAQCLGSDLRDLEPEDLCLCADDVPDRDKAYDVSDDVMVGLLRWWKNVMTNAGPDELFTQYLPIVARFAGPASTVSIVSVNKPGEYLPYNLHTKSQAVAETGDRFTRYVLHPIQVNILRQNEPRVFLFGPPGTGKSFVLVLKAVQWLQEERQVVILSAHRASLAVSHLIEYQVRQTAGSLAGNKLHLLVTDKTSVVVELLKRVDEEGRLHVIADEAGWYNERNMEHNDGLPRKLCRMTTDNTMKLMMM